MPQLQQLYDRSFEDAGKDDENCVIKTAIAKTFAAFEHQDPTPFLMGLRHGQYDGGSPSRDSAITLRVVCTGALVQCRDLSDVVLLRTLIPVLRDPERVVRLTAVRIDREGQNGHVFPAPPSLRRAGLRAGGSARSLLHRSASHRGSIRHRLGKQFLVRDDDTAVEAAMAISETHTPEAFRILRDRWASAFDPWFQEALLTAVALTRQEEAYDWLLKLVKKSPREARMAQQALCQAAPPEEILRKLASLGRPCPTR